MLFTRVAVLLILFFLNKDYFVNGDFTCDGAACAYCKYSSFVSKCATYCATHCASNDVSKSQLASSTSNAQSNANGAQSGDQTLTGNDVSSGQSGSSSAATGSFPNPTAVRMLKECCDQYITPDVCLALCDYNVTKETIYDLCYPPRPRKPDFPDPKNCSLIMTKKVFYCASWGNDNRACCQRKGLFPKYKQCMPFCTGLPEFNTFTVDMYACLEDDILRKIMECNHEALLPNLGQIKGEDVAARPQTLTQTRR